MKRLTLFSIVLFLVCSCEEQLEEVPKNFISNVNFWANADDAEAGVRGLYRVDLIDPFDEQFLEIHSDFAKGRGSWAPLSIWQSPMANAEIGRAATYFWNRPYQIINNVNTVLENLPPIEMNETRKTILLAEARFLRAMQYFNLVRGFGPVPLRLTATKDLTTIDAPRAPIDEVYTAILDDLTFAEANLPVTQGADTRRPTNWAAKQVMAEVYLTRENWSLAAAKAQEVIASGRFAIVPITTANDFYNIFARRPTTEDVLSIHYSSTISDSYVLTLHIANVPAYNNGSQGFFTTIPNTTSIIGTAWNAADLRKGFNMYTQYVSNTGATINLPATTPILFKKIIAQPDGIRSNARYLLRFTENYLIYAEAASMAGGAPTVQALEYLNIVRRRAYGRNPFAPSTIDYPAGMSITAFRDAVLLERAYEFINEQQRWWDLRRTNTVKQVIGAAFGVAVHDSRILWPIPQDEINNNGALSQADQNPGY
jgi:hypothetical protein